MARNSTGRVIGGVDTHKHEHVAAVIDDLGRIQDVASFPTTRHGYRRLLAWMQSHGELVAVGVEGCGSWGAGLARYLTARRVRVVEVNRPNRQKRRLRGKSDTVDAEAAARAVLSGEATVTPKSGDGPVEAVRQLRVARNGAMKSRTAAANQLHSLIDTAPDALRERLIGLTLRKKIAVIERWRPGTTHTPEMAAKRALVSVARRWRALDLEVTELDRHLRANPADDRRAAARPARRRLRNRRTAPRHRRRQPRPDAQRSELRRALRQLAGQRVIRQDQTTSAQPRRRPPRQLGAVDHRPHPHVEPPTDTRLRRTPNHRRALQARHHPLPQALRRPRNVPPRPRHRERTRAPTRCLTSRGALTYSAV